MMGVSAFSEEVNNTQAGIVPRREEIASSRENLKNSVGSLQSKIDSARVENEKGLAGLKLELIQLMEQGLRFAIREGGRTVASGVVSEIIK